MSEFLERNKRKGALAGLLLLLKRGRGAGPALLMATLLALVFILPSGVRSRLGSFLGFDEKPEYSDDGQGGGAFGDMSEAMRASRQRDLKRSSSLPGGGDMAFYGRSSVNYVKGEDPRKDKNKKSTYDGLAGGGKTVDGILRPEDAKKMKEGVVLDAKELENGLLKNAFAGGFGEGMGAAGAAGGGGVSGGGLMRRPGVSDRDADLARASLGGQAPSGGVTTFKSGDRRRLQFDRFRALAKRVGSALKGLQEPNKNTAMYDLVRSRAYSVAAAPPPGFCGNNCPREFASNTGGATFDGGRIGDSILNAEQFGDPSVPVTPDAGDIQPLIDKANQMEEDAKKCEAAKKKYAPLEQAKMAEMQAHADKLNGMCCDCGGCSASKAKACKKVGDQMRVTCGEVNKLAYEHHMACPLRTGPAPSQDCNQ